MKFQFELLEPPVKYGDKKKRAHEKLKELCLMMVEEAVKRDGVEDIFIPLNEEEKEGNDSQVLSSD